MRFYTQLILSCLSLYLIEGAYGEEGINSVNFSPWHTESKLTLFDNNYEAQLQLPSDMNIGSTINLVLEPKDINGSERIAATNIMPQMANAAADVTQNIAAVSTDKDPVVSKVTVKTSAVSAKDPGKDEEMQVLIANFIQYGLPIVGLILFSSIVVFFVLRVKSRSHTKFDGADTIMEIVSTLIVSKKRKIILVRIKNKEILISNTEFGMSVISDTSAPMLFSATQHSQKNHDKIHTHKIKDELLLKQLDSEVQLSTQLNINSSNNTNVTNLTNGNNHNNSIHNSNNTNNEKSDILSGNKRTFSSNTEDDEIKRNVGADSHIATEDVASLIREKMKILKQLG